MSEFYRDSMSEFYRDFIDRKADAIINGLGGTITPAPANAELYRDFLERKFDDVINALPSGPSSEHHYSTTEQIVGTWIDGSVIYEKTYHIIPNGDTSYTAFDNIFDLNLMLSMVFTAKRFDSVNDHTWFYTGSGSTSPEPAPYRDYKIAVRIFDNNLEYSIAGYGTEITDIWCVVQYTKKTNT